MAEQKMNDSEALLGFDIDFFTICRDVIKSWWIILALALSAALLSYIQVNRSYRPSYTIEATYVVKAKGVNNSVYDNLTKAKDAAARFSQIINSPTMMNKVREDLGDKIAPGTAFAEIVPETNLLTLKVTAGTPEAAFCTLKSVMENYPTISEYLVGDAILDVLMAPVIPTEPDRALYVKGPMRRAAVIMALAMIAVLAFFSYMKDTIRKESDVKKKLDTRLLGSLCHEEKNKTLSSKIRKSNRGLLISSPMISFRYEEMLQKACRRVQNRLEQRDAKTLLVTSCLENEGKSTVTANLALALARSGKKVVLIDLDLRKPAQYKLFDLFGQKHTGLGKALMGEPVTERIIDAVYSRELYTIFNTKEYSQSTEMLTGGRLEIILDYLKERFDFIIIDTPPMAYAADTEEIANMVDASLIVVREHISSARDINDMLDVLNNCKGTPIGCIFNDAHGSMSGALFGEQNSGYGNGYGRYYGRMGK